MDVSLHFSGGNDAIVLRRFNLVQSSNQYIFLEINFIQDLKLQLVLQLLLYCSMSVCSRFLAPDAFKFAFPRAGRWEDRRQEDRSFLQANMVTYGGLTCQIPGYRFFCSDIMPMNHELIHAGRHTAYRILKVMRYKNLLGFGRLPP